jgi:multimeric flavodoxin WrbA
VADGATAAGAQVETFFLHAMNIQPCSACDARRKKLKKDCVIKDDMKILYPKRRPPMPL